MAVLVAHAVFQRIVAIRSDKRLKVKRAAHLPVIGMLQRRPAFRRRWNVLRRPAQYPRQAGAAPDGACGNIHVVVQRARRRLGCRQPLGHQPQILFIALLPRDVLCDADRALNLSGRACG